MVTGCWEGRYTYLNCVSMEINSHFFFKAHCCSQNQTFSKWLLGTYMKILIFMMTVRKSPILPLKIGEVPITCSKLVPLSHVRGPPDSTTLVYRQAWCTAMKLHTGLLGHCSSTVRPKPHNLPCAEGTVRTNPVSTVPRLSETWLTTTPPQQGDHPVSVIQNSLRSRVLSVPPGRPSLRCPNTSG